MLCHQEAQAGTGCRSCGISWNSAASLTCYFFFPGVDASNAARFNERLTMADGFQSLFIRQLRQPGCAGVLQVLDTLGVDWQAPDNDGDIQCQPDACLGLTLRFAADASAATLQHASLGGLTGPSKNLLVPLLHFKNCASSNLPIVLREQLQSGAPEH